MMVGGSQRRGSWRRDASRPFSVRANTSYLPLCRLFSPEKKSNPPPPPPVLLIVGYIFIRRPLDCGFVGRWPWVLIIPLFFRPDLIESASQSQHSDSVLQPLLLAARPPRLSISFFVWKPLWVACGSLRLDEAG